MSAKKDDMKFTIQFSKTNPLHIQVADILNRQDKRGKAQYITNAILHYENGGTPDARQPARNHEKMIEIIVNRLLRGKSQGTEVKHDSGISVKRTELIEEINFDGAMDSIGEDGFNAIAGALDMFRKK